MTVGGTQAFKAARAAMVERQLRARGIGDEGLLAAFGEVPREVFVDDGLAALAYDDRPLPIGFGQTISQPYVVALMIEAAGVGPQDRVLEIGAGSGYSAAILGRVAASVVAIERHLELAAAAQDRLARMAVGNVRVVAGDGTLGWPAAAPYDAILAAASGREVPPALVAQLATGGRLVMPLGAPARVQHMVKLTKNADGSLRRIGLGAVRFVPLIGAQGWADE